jgi:hypothetical protein
MRRAWRWLWRIVLGALALAVIAIVAAIIALHTGWGREQIRRRVEAALATSFPGGAKIGRLDGSVFGELVARDVELDDADGRPQLVVGTARIRLELWPLISKIARFDSLIAEDVVVDVRRSTPGAAPPPPTPPSPPSPWSVELPQLEIHRARVTVERDGTPIDITEVELVANLSIDRGATTARVSAHGRWRDRAGAASAILHVADGQLDVPFAAATVGDARATLAGGRAEPGVDAFAGTVALQLPAPLLHELADVDLPGDAAVVVTAFGDGLAVVSGRVAETNVHAFADVDLARRHARGLVFGGASDRGVLAGAFGEGTRRLTGIAVIDGSTDGGWVVAALGADVADAHGTLIARVNRDDRAITLARAAMVGHARDVHPASAPGASAATVDARIAAAGPLWPDPELRVTGHVDVGGVRRDGRLLGAASVDARATLARGDSYTIELGSHQLRTVAAGVWSGSGGRLVVDRDRIELRGFHTGRGGGAVTAGGSFTRGTGDLAADASLRDVPIALVSPTTAGRVAGTLAVNRRGGAWSGGAVLHGRGVGVETYPVFDVDTDVKVRGRRVTEHGTVTSTIGSATIALDVDGPRELTDLAAWRRLERSALHDAAVTLAGVDTTPFHGRGIVDGDLALTATGARGQLRIRAIATPAGDVDSEVTIAAGDNGEVVAALAPRLAEHAVGDGSMRVVLPVHVFDPAAWRTLGRGALVAATLNVTPFAFDETTLARLKIHAPLHGRVEGTIDVAAGAASVTAIADLHDVSGGPLVRPLAAHVEATFDGSEVVATGTVGAGRTTLAELVGHAPITIDQLRAGGLRATPIAATIRIPTDVQARDVLALVGRSDVTGGTLGGTVELGGTVAVPTGHGTLTALAITIPPSLTGRPPSKLDDLVVTARWDGATGELEATAHEPAGGLLKVTARGRPDQPAKLVASLEAARFDIAPFTAFAPGVFVAARGLVDASLSLDGFDPDTGDLRGMLHVHDGRLPLASMIGTVRSAELDATIADHAITARVAGKLGKGEVRGNATITLVGSTPSRADITVAFKQVSLIRAHQPIIDATATAKLAHATDRWTGTITIANGKVVVPAVGGVSLLDVGAPSDLVFVDAPPLAVVSLLQKPAPKHPWLVAEVDLQRTTVDVLEDEYQVRGAVSGHLTLSLGDDTIGVDGAIDAHRGDISLLGQRSQLDHGSMVFDGTLDPLLNARVVRDLTNLTVTVEVGGRLSKPDITFSSDSGSYTQGELAGFFLGGQPGADRGEVGQAGISAGVGYASALITKRLNRVLPVKLDFNFEPATSISSQAIRIGRWINDHLFVAGRQHLEARPDENGNEMLGEYHFLGDTLLQGNLGDRGFAGLDVVHRWRW